MTHKSSELSSSLYLMIAGSRDGAIAACASLRSRPLATCILGEAPLFQCLQRKGYGSIVDSSACGLHTLGDLSSRYGAMLVKNLCDRRADGLTWRCLTACRR